MNASLSLLVDSMRVATIAGNDTGTMGAAFIASLMPAGKAGAARTAKHGAAIADCLNEAGAPFVDALRSLACLKGKAEQEAIAVLLKGTPSAKDKKRAAALEKSAARMLGKKGTGNPGTFLNGCAIATACKRAGFNVSLKEGVFTVAIISDEKAAPRTLADMLDSIEKEANKEEGKWTMADIVAACAARYGADIAAMMKAAPLAPLSEAVTMPEAAPLANVA